MTALGVVEAFDPFEDRGGEIVAGSPPLAVEELELQGSEEASATALSPAEPMDPSRPAARRRRPNAHDVYWVPWSECTIVPSAPWRRHNAICNASSTTAR